jgi:hypothetical protein
MKLALISMSLYALLCAALPQDTESYFREQCSSNELSCCSNLKSTAEANGNTIDQNQGNQNQDVGSGIGVLVSVLTGNTLNQAANIIPISILSGCPHNRCVLICYSRNSSRRQLLNAIPRQCSDHVCELYRMLRSW